MQDKPEQSKSITKLSEQLKRKTFRPSDFMRARHPELFSDSSMSFEPNLTREVFEYHLELLTSRKEETVFEHFCRRLAEKELCPNLSPQTGPTGGGDSKCDAETYPVADQIAMRWYEGKSTGAPQERWAFAFSAKQEWRSKARSDVKGIAATGRGYTLIYFITSRYAKDKTRATLEDELTRDYAVKVRILDRSWILRCVYEHDRLQLAVETLNLDETSVKSGKRVGPRDVRNTEKLSEVEERIQDTTRYSGVEYQLAEDCLRAALLARGLELPRVEIDGRFERAEKIARGVGHPQQRLRIAYNRAWTAYWWFEDLSEFNRFYDQVQLLAASSDQATDLELLANLWTILHASRTAGTLDDVAADLPRRTATLVKAIEELANDTSRPNNSLWARTQLLLMKMSSAVNKSDELGALLTDFRGILRSAEGLMAYPFEAVSRIVEELGEWLSEAGEYDELLEQVVSMTQKRVGSREVGRILLARGFQKFRTGQTYDAIRFFGRAQQKLALQESLEELAEALFSCGLAYESAGLLWAARANVLSAADLTLSEYWQHGFLASQASTCARRLVWLELQLGRPACAMQWMQVASALAHNQGLDEEERERFSDQVTAQDATLGILLLRSELEDLNRLRFLPDVLDQCGLQLSRMALLYALGYEDLLRDEATIPPTETPEEVRELFTTMLKHPGSADLPDRPVGLGGGTMTLTSHVLGCTFNVHTEEDDESLLLAERILAATEALLATSLELDVFPNREELSVNVERSHRVEGLPQCQFDESRAVANVRHSGFIPDSATTRDNWFLVIVLKIVGHMIIPRHPERYAERVFDKEVGLARALNFTESTTPIKNILGRNPKFRLSDWNNEKNPRAFAVRREIPWHEGLFRTEKGEIVAEPTTGVGNPPKELLDRSLTKHSDRRVFSLINMPLWDRAKWFATLYIWSENPDAEPFLALAFADSDSGQAIFREWRTKLGKIDDRERLRVSIITGIDKAHPPSYKVVIGSNLRVPKDSSGVREFVVISRINRMRPQDSKNLETFRARYERVRRYGILPAFLPEINAEPELFFDLSIKKQSIRICPAWEIGENDPDSVAIDPKDDVVVPPEVKEAPILRLLDRRRRQSSKDG
jgi:hypothetical protein